MAFAEVGAEIEFKGAGIDEKGFVKSVSNADFSIAVGQEVVSVDPAYFRPTEVELLIGDPTKSRTKLGWEPEYDLAALCKEMVASDVAIFRKHSKTQWEHLAGYGETMRTGNNKIGRAHV